MAVRVRRLCTLKTSSSFAATSSSAALAAAPDSRASVSIALAADLTAAPDSRPAAATAVLAGQGRPWPALAGQLGRPWRPRPA